MAFMRCCCSSLFLCFCSVGGIVVHPVTLLSSSNNTKGTAKAALTRGGYVLQHVSKEAGELRMPETETLVQGLAPGLKNFKKCNKDCSGNGDCVEGHCKCYAGFASKTDADDDCAEEIGLPDPDVYDVGPRIPIHPRLDDGSSDFADEFSTRRLKCHFLAWDKSPMCGGLAVRGANSSADDPFDDRDHVCPGQHSICSTDCMGYNHETDIIMELPPMEEDNDCAFHDVRNVRCNADVSDNMASANAQCVACISRAPECKVTTRWVECLNAANGDMDLGLTVDSVKGWNNPKLTAERRQKALQNLGIIEEKANEKPKVAPPPSAAPQQNVWLSDEAQGVAIQEA